LRNKRVEMGELGERSLLGIMREERFYSISLRNSMMNPD
jgi:hypothetical protein